MLSEIGVKKSEDFSYNKMLAFYFKYIKGDVSRIRRAEKGVLAAPWMPMAPDAAVVLNFRS